MTLQAEKKTPEQMVEAIFALDLEPIKFKLMDKEEGYGWTREEADRNELEYKRFLALVAKYPDDMITPDTTVDKFWHGHILDTMKYAEDCHNVFGYFLHHFPYFGMRGEEDAANLAEAAAHTRRLYQQEFGEADVGSVAYCTRATAAYCTSPAASYCTHTAGEVNKSAAYCTAPAAAYCTSAGSKRAAYCTAANAGHPATVLEKGRPRPDSAAA